MVAEELDDRLQIRLPVVWPPFKVHKDRGYAGLNKQCHRIFQVLVEVGIKDSLVHKVHTVSDIEQNPAQVVEPERR